MASSFLAGAAGAAGAAVAAGAAAGAAGAAVAAGAAAAAGAAVATGAAVLELVSLELDAGLGAGSTAAVQLINNKLNTADSMLSPNRFGVIVASIDLGIPYSTLKVQMKPLPELLNHITIAGIGVKTLAITATCGGADPQHRNPGTRRTRTHPNNEQPVNRHQIRLMAQGAHKSDAEHHFGETATTESKHAA